MKKALLMELVLVATTLSALAQAKLAFVNDSQHYFVLGGTAPLDAGLGGGTTNGSVGAIPASPLPSGYTLIAALYGSTNSSDLTLWDQVPLTASYSGAWYGPGLMVPQHLVLNGIPANCVTSYWTVVVADSIGTNVLQTEALSHYFGASPEFTLVLCGGTIAYPTILPGGAWQSTWAPENVVIDYMHGQTPPAISQQPQSQSVWLGSNASLTASSAGPGVVGLEWWKDGTLIPGATSSNYTVMSAAYTDAGSYYAVFTNSYVSSTSSVAVLQVLPFEAPSISVNNQLAVGTVQAGGSALVTMSGGFTNGYIFYTLDGTTPTTSSMLYNGPITLTNSATVQAMSLSGDFSQSALAPAVTVQISPAYNLQTSVLGEGAIMANPPNGPYVSNTIVVLTAVASSTNWAFDHWGGDATGTQNPVSVTMNGPRSVQAVFVQTAFPLTVSTPGGGSATVNGQTIQPVTYYSAGSVLILSAAPNNDWVFLGWQGDASGTNNPLSLTITQTNNIQAIFGTIVATNAVGPGEIVLSPPNPVPFGTATVTAVASPGNYFRTWSGAASGTNSPATISVTTPGLSVGALFAAVPAGECTLNVVVNGPGTVNVNPQQAYYDLGATVALTATATNAGTSFTGWSEDASGTANPLNLVLNTNKVVQANFVTTITLTQPTRLAGGAFQFTFTNTPGANFSVWGSPNIALPLSNWAPLGSASQVSSGRFQFTDFHATN